MVILIGFSRRSSLQTSSSLSFTSQGPRIFGLIEHASGEWHQQHENVNWCKFGKRILLDAIKGLDKIK